MTTDAENLATIRTNLLTKLAAVSSSPKASYSIDGQSVSWNDYYMMLWRQLEMVNQQMTSVGGAFEVETIGEA